MCGRYKEIKEYLKCDNEPYQSIVSECKGLEEYAVELEKTKERLEMTIMA